MTIFIFNSKKETKVTNLEKKFYGICTLNQKKKKTERNIERTKRKGKKKN